MHHPDRTTVTEYQVRVLIEQREVTTDDLTGETVHRDRFTTTGIQARGHFDNMADALDVFDLARKPLYQRTSA